MSVRRAGVDDRGAAAEGRRTAADDRRAAAERDLARAGVRDGRVELVVYDPAWPALYETERERLEPLLPGSLEIHHIGSTAVPGLLAKPIIDIVALVDDLDAPIAALIGSGYQYARAFNATLSHRRFLCYPTASHRTHHLHLVDDRSELERRLYFRDRLRADPALAAEYVALKRTLAARYPEDREAYTEAKAPFIGHVERQATSEDTPARSIANSDSELVFRAATVSDAEQLGRAIAEGFQGYLSFAPAGWTPRSAEDETKLLRALLERDDFCCLLAWAERAPAERVLAGNVGFSARHPRVAGRGGLRPRALTPAVSRARLLGHGTCAHVAYPRAACRLRTRVHGNTPVHPHGSGPSQAVL